MPACHPDAESWGIASAAVASALLRVQDLKMTCAGQPHGLRLYLMRFSNLHSTVLIGGSPGMTGRFLVTESVHLFV